MVEKSNCWHIRLDIYNLYSFVLSSNVKGNQDFYQFPPLFSYKKQKDGNYTFEGIVKDHLDLLFGYLKMRLKYLYFSFYI